MVCRFLRAMKASKLMLYTMAGKGYLLVFEV